MGVASLVLGILSIVFCWVPCVGWLAVVPGIIGIILGGAGIATGGQDKGCAIAGLILSILATIFAIWWVLVLGAAAAAV